MGYEVAYLGPDVPAMHLRMFGSGSREEVDAAMAELVGLALEHDTWRLLSDYRDMVWTMDVAGVKETADAVHALGIADRFRQALIDPVDVTARAYVEYWETFMTNRGLRVKRFTDPDEALAWLVAED